ncbi:TPA: DUF4386 domain-containing protein [Thermoplasmata archaeon]|nr:DUF4386 domain-containing protein [Thermoplasmata archaeon]
MKLSSFNNVPKLLGVAFLVVIVTTLVSSLFTSVGGTGSISEVMVNISDDVPLVRLGIIGGMANSTAIVFLAVLLYVVLSRENKTMATVALGFWLIEAAFYAIMQLGALALIPVSQDFVASGSPADSFYQSMGGFLYDGVYQTGMTIHMWFYCMGGILWYYMFYTSRSIPRVISAFGIFAVAVGIVGLLAELAGSEVAMIFFILILPFELAIGFWLVLKGIEGWPPVGSGDGAG